MEILKVQNLSKVYGKGDTQIKALDDLSFSVEKGEFVAIVGASGSGKSTLLHILGGVDTPTSGQVLVDGTDICALDKTKLAIFRRRQIGLIYQFYNLIPILNVEENISLPLLLDGRSLDEDRLKEIVATLGLSDRVRHLPNQLSGGQQQRVSIGRALINNPALILADEPTGTGNLDSANSKEIIALLKLSNQRYHQTLIVVTHDRDIAPRPTASISSATGASCATRQVREAPEHEHPDDLYPEVPATEQEAHCGDHLSDPLRCHDLRGVPTRGELPAGDDRPRDLHVRQLAMPSFTPCPMQRRNISPKTAPFRVVMLSLPSASKDGAAITQCAPICMSLPMTLSFHNHSIKLISGRFPKRG
ncbi:MAG: ABC transporter ATP-binding protein [Caldilineaceae bacterium]